MTSNVPRSTAANVAPAYFSLRLTMFKLCAGRRVCRRSPLILRRILPLRRLHRPPEYRPGPVAVGRRLAARRARKFAPAYFFDTLESLDDSIAIEPARADGPLGHAHSRGAGARRAPACGRDRCGKR